MGQWEGSMNLAPSKGRRCAIVLATAYMPWPAQTEKLALAYRTKHSYYGPSPSDPLRFGMR